MLDYRSKIALAKRCGVIIRPPQLVFPGDEYQAAFQNGALVIHHVRGATKRIEHYEYREPLDFSLEPAKRWKKRIEAGFSEQPNFTHAYVFWVDGAEVLGEVMDREQLDGIRRRSKAGNDGPWDYSSGLWRWHWLKPDLPLQRHTCLQSALEQLAHLRTAGHAAARSVLRVPLAQWARWIPSG